MKCEGSQDGRRVGAQDGAITPMCRNKGEPELTRTLTLAQTLTPCAGTKASQS